MRIVGTWGAAAALLLVGCGAPAPVGSTSSDELADSDYISQQGSLLLGFTAPDVRNFALPPSITNPRVTAAGQLVSDRLSGRGFVGVPVTASARGATIAMRIRDVQPPAGATDRWHYALDEWDAVGGRWLKACADPPQVLPPASAQPPFAIALSGSWTPDGTFVENASAISFACSSGVVAKCVEWSYASTWVPPRVTQTGQPTTASGADVLQACTRMARADYCAAGVPNTLDGTPIHVHDAFGGPRRPERDVPGFFLEAAWPPSTPAGKGQGKPQPALCLSKQRWSTLPLGGGCPLSLPDPRLDPNARFCEDYDLAALEAQGALVYADSSYIDAGLYSFSDPWTQAALTSSRLVPGRAGTLPSWHIAPPPGLPFPQPGQTSRFEGALFSPDAPPIIIASGLIPLRSFWCPGDDYITTSTDLGASCAPIAVEGYVYPPNAPGHAPLRRWWNPVTGHSLTTTRSATSMAADGWQLAEVVGALPRAAMDINVRWSAGYPVTLDLQMRSGEWIAPCFDAARLSGASQATYSGVCPSVPGRPVIGADIAAFRVQYATAGGPRSAVSGYDGAASDVYIDVPGGVTTALALSWADQGADASYAFDLHTGGAWTTGCATEHALANGVGAVYLGRCPDSNAAVALADIDAVRVCAAVGHDWAHPRCASAAYDGHQSSLAVALP